MIVVGIECEECYGGVLKKSQRITINLKCSRK